MALLNSLHANSHSDSIRLWMFQEKGDDENEILEGLKNSPENFFPVENIRFLHYQNEKELEFLLPQIEQKYLSERQERLTSGILHRNLDEEKRVHELFTDQHNYIRYYIPSILDSFFRNNDNDNNNIFSTPPKQFLYLDCDMIVLKDPMILMRQVEPRLGAKKGVCMAAAGREDPSLLDSLGPEGESEQTLKELGIPADMTLSFNAGMLVVDIDCWIQRKAKDNLLRWLEIRTSTPVYRQGSQPPLLLSFVPEHTEIIKTEYSHLYPPLLRYAVVGEEWDAQARNCVDKISSNVGIVHFTGKNKPWQMIIDNPYQQNIWEQYAPLSLLPADRPVVPPEETAEEKAERRERLFRMEMQKYGKVLTPKEKEEERQKRLERLVEKKLRIHRMAFEKEKRLAEKMASKVKSMQQKTLEKELKSSEEKERKFTTEQLERQNEWQTMRGEKILVEQEKRSLEKNQKTLIKMHEKGRQEKFVSEDWKGLLVGEGIKLVKVVNMEEIWEERSDKKTEGGIARRGFVESRFGVSR